MGNLEIKSKYKKAFAKYLNENNLTTNFEKSMGWNNEEAHLGVFDLPPNYIPFKDGYMHCGEEFRAKPVLTGIMNPDGTVTVKETEYTKKYLFKQTI